MSGADTTPDDFEPADLPAKARAAYGDKLALGTSQTLALAVMAGAFIAFGSVFFLIVQSVPDTVPSGFVQALSGAAFSFGLILVMIAGAELFTGNTLMLSRLYAGDSGMGQIAAAWALVYLGNLIGSVLIVALFLAAGGAEAGDGLMQAAILDTAGSKTAKGAGAIFASGILANMLVCLAVWMTFAARTLPGKVLVIVPPIAAFVAGGFEHSVANMSLIPAGLGVLWTESGAVADPSLTAAGFAHNLLWSTLGNIVGGGLIALGYWLGYDREA